MTVTTERATADDLDAICRLENESLAEWSRPSWRAELDGAGRDVLIARDGADVVGVITVQTVGQVAELLRLIVSPGRRRQGIGTELITAGVRAAADRGAGEMLLEVRIDNDPAIAAYQRFGFEQFGSRTNYYGNGKHALIMKLYDLRHPWPGLRIDDRDRARRGGQR